MKKNIIIFLLGLVIVPFFASCSWAELPCYEEAEISAIQLYARWASDQKDALTGEAIMREQKLNTTCNVDTKAATITVDVTVPEVNAVFTEAARAGVSQSKLWGQATISTAARLTPCDGTAKLGTPDDWTKEKKFSVMAANGTTKVWTVKVNSFTK